MNAITIIGRCATTGCTNRRTRTLDGQTIAPRIPANNPDGHVTASWKPHGRPSIHRGQRGDGPVYAAAMTAAGWVCETHDRYMTLVKVRGISNAAVLCDWSCTHAFHAVCVCSCEGLNHGAAWAAPALIGVAA